MEFEALSGAAARPRCYARTSCILSVCRQAELGASAFACAGSLLCTIQRAEEAHECAAGNRAASKVQRTPLAACARCCCRAAP